MVGAVAEKFHFNCIGVLMRLYILVMTIVLCLGATALADIYKCVSEDGVVKFSDEPCSKKAEVAFETEELDFDTAVGNASPYPKLPIPPSRFDTEDMMARAKKIGRCIITDEYNNAARFEKYPSRGNIMYRVYLYFGPASDDWRYIVKMTYEVNKKFEGWYVWLDKFEVTKHRKPYDSRSMNNVRTFKKMGKGVWEIRNKGSNWQ
jgi:hypothetical protein